MNHFPLFRSPMRKHALTNIPTHYLVCNISTMNYLRPVLSYFFLLYLIILKRKKEHVLISVCPICSSDLILIFFSFLCSLFCGKFFYGISLRFFILANYVYHAPKDNGGEPSNKQIIDALACIVEKVDVPFPVSFGVVRLCIFFVYY